MPSALNVMFPLSNFFGSNSDPSSFTSGNNGQGPAPGQLATEGITPDQDSLTQYLRSLSNYTGTTGQSVLGTGQGWTGQAADYWSKILSGNKSAIAEAMQPEITATADQFAGARRSADQFAPMGGGRASMMGNLPFQQAGIVSNIIAQARPGAASNLANIGMGESGLGTNLLGQALQALAARRGQNVQQSGQNMALAGQLGGAALGAFG